VKILHDDHPPLAGALRRPVAPSAGPPPAGRSAPGPRRPAQSIDRITPARICASALVVVGAAVVVTLAAARPVALGDEPMIVAAGLVVVAGAIGHLAQLARRSAALADALAAKEACLEDLFARSSDAILVLDRDGRWASGCRSTTSARAARRWAACTASRSTPPRRCG
jgi:hypothetical protein